MRLDAAVALACGISRSDARAAIRSGRVTVNGEPETRETRAVAVNDAVCRDGEPLDLREHLYLMLNKPAGTVCTSAEDSESVLRLLPERFRRRLFCVGRLDKDTTGLLFLTDDGAFSHHLTSPKHQTEKVYEVILARPLSEEARCAVEKGLTLGNGETTFPCRVIVTAPERATVVLLEGKYHQVKRMFAAVGNRVTALRRSAVGGISLDPSLPSGGYRELTEEEYRALTD